MQINGEAKSRINRRPELERALLTESKRRRSLIIQQLAARAGSLQTRICPLTGYAHKIRGRVGVAGQVRGQPGCAVYPAARCINFFCSGLFQFRLDRDLT